MNTHHPITNHSLRLGMTLALALGGCYTIDPSAANGGNGFYCGPQAGGATCPSSYFCGPQAADGQQHCCSADEVTEGKPSCVMTTPPDLGGTNHPPDMSSGGGADTTPPYISITAPAVVVGGVVITAIATDNVGVVQVQFFDGTLLGTDTTPPYALAWDSKQVPNGNHSLSAEAKDAAGNVANSGIVVVRVANTTPPYVAADRCVITDFESGWPTYPNQQRPIGPAVGQTGADCDSDTRGLEGAFKRGLEGAACKMPDGTANDAACEQKGGKNLHCDGTSFKCAK